MSPPSPRLAAGPATMPSTITETIVEPRLTQGDEGEHDRFAHYVRKEDIMRSAVEGVAVIALCGKKWIPNRDPQRYPVCPSCKEIFESLSATG
jgi:hypothetical protein